MPEPSSTLFTGNPAEYSDEQWASAALLDKGESLTDAKQRYALPVREPDGTLNRGALAAAAQQLAKSDEELGADSAVLNAARSGLQKAYIDAGLPVRLDVEKARLSTAQRDALPASDFVFPDTREFPYQDEEHGRKALQLGANDSRIATIKRKVKARYPQIEVSKAELELATVVPLLKDETRQIAYGVVLSPDLVDSQGDVVSAQEIEKAAHRFLTEYRKHDEQHAEDGQRAETVESYIAPDDLTIDGQRVLKGSWVIGVHVTDPATWEKVRKGEITGFSIGGSGERVPFAA